MHISALRLIFKSHFILVSLFLCTTSLLGSGAAFAQDDSLSDQSVDRAYERPDYSLPDEDDPYAVDDDYNPDIFEGFNRKMFSFNFNFLLPKIVQPIYKGYRAVTPNPVERGVSNFFSNLGEIKVIVNDVLQGKGKQAASDTGRFLINSTVGIAGIFDVATKLKLRKHDENFGQTLGVWGVPKGPFIMLPGLGPTTPRFLVGSGFDATFDPVLRIKNEKVMVTVFLVRILTSFGEQGGLLEMLDNVNGDRYVFVRDAYMQLLEFQTQDGQVEDSFLGDDEDEEDIYDL